MRAVSSVATACKMLLGMLFFFSAASKYIALDQFELYIYSFDLFSQAACFILARLLLAGELLLGALLLSNRYHRLACFSNTLFLLMFCFFLCYAQLIGRTDNCNCFGDILKFDPVQSLLKNALLLLVTLFVWKYSNQEWRPRWWLAVLMVLFPFETLIGLGRLGLVHMIYMQRDLMYTLIGSMSAIGVLSSLFLWRPNLRKSIRVGLLTLMAVTPLVAVAVVSTAPEDWKLSTYKEPFDSQVVKTVLQPGYALQDVRSHQGRRVVAFYSLHCVHCQATAQKVYAVQRHNALPDSAFVNVFLSADTLGFSQFYETTQTPRFRSLSLDPELFLTITKYQFPLVLLIDGDSIYSSFSTVVPEKEILEFLK